MEPPGKLAVIIWHLLKRGEDYAWVRPALHAKKLRDLELRSGQPVRRDSASASDDQGVFRINRRLDVIAHRRAAASAPRHRTTVRVSPRELALTTALPRRRQVLVA